MDLFVIALLFIAVAPRREPAAASHGFLGYCFPKRILTHPSVRTDIKLILALRVVMPMVNVLWRLSTVFFAGLVLQGLVAVFGPPLNLFTWNTTSAIALTLLITFADDLGFYLCHLAHHKIPVLWAFHKVHHSAEVMTPLTTSRNHPVEFVLIGPARALGSGLALGPVLYLFGTAPTTIELLGLSVISGAFGLLGSHLSHSHIWLTWPPFLQRIFVCPAHHQIHHSSALRHHDKNMAGTFSFWDWLFGTLYIAPRQREAFRLGVYGTTQQPHPGLVAAFVVPFFDAARAVLPWAPAPLRDRLTAWTRQAEARFNAPPATASGQPLAPTG
jgi:sterol desaturase/sphingolipid hydroxylase (fatty acid hydroxylase superfamily)